MATFKIIVGITQGDSNGIGYEVIIKALSDPRIMESFIPVIYGSSKLFGFYKNQIKFKDSYKVETHVINSAKDVKPGKINIINCVDDTQPAEPGKATPASAKAAIMSLERAVADIKNNDIDVIVTAPINKQAMKSEGFDYTGHTEYFRNIFGADDVAMLLISDMLKIGLVTSHTPIKDISGQITEEEILKKLEIINKSLICDFNITSPKIAVLGLNPHCGDGGLIGEEEENIIIPAIRKAEEKGIWAFGPFSADGFFGAGDFKKFDAVLAMYHDQGLAPFKTISFETGVNYTAGLPVVRTSPDHGTAFDNAGKDCSDATSMRMAIYSAIDIFKNRIAWYNLMENRMTEYKQIEKPIKSDESPHVGE